MKKWLTLVLSVLLALALFGAFASAAEPAEVTDYNEMTSLIRDGLLAREETIRFRYTGDDYRAPSPDDLFAYGEYGAAGDYLRLSFNGAFPEAVQEEDGSYTVTPAYYTTASQEAAVAAYVSDALAGCTATEDEAKARWIYDYLCDNVQFDLENLYNEEDLLKYTAYGAVSEGKAVCQGFAQLYYRMAKAAGLDCRIVTGTRAGENHAWNIVKLGDKWYHVDAACGAQLLENDGYFMQPSFGKYTIRYGTYTANEIKDYPFPAASDSNLITGALNYNISYVMDRSTGTAVFSGNGDLPTDNSVFSGNVWVHSVVFEEGITGGAKGVFFGTGNRITEISFPASMVDIQNSVIYYCQLEHVHVNEGNPVYHSDGDCLIKTADKELVFGTKNSVIPADGSVTRIGPGAFYGNFNVFDIRELVIPDAVTSIGGSAFYNTKLRSITLPGSIQEIGSYVFKSCDDLTDVTLAAGFSAPISGDVFFDCPALERVTVEEGNQYYVSDTNGALFNADGTELVYFPAASLLTAYEIPEEVTAIGEMAFCSNIHLESVSFPGKIPDFGNSAFSSCNALKTLDIHDLTDWMRLSFADRSCNPLKNGVSLSVNGELLTELTIPEGVTQIGDYQFYGCQSILHVTIPGSVSAIGKSAFRECAHLLDITAVDGLTSIGENAFWGCIELRETVLPDSIADIGSCAFYGCNSLTNLVVPAGLSEISPGLFMECDGLTDVTIPEGITTIKQGAFQRCDNLANVRLPNSLTKIEQEAFYRCYLLKRIVIPDSVTSIGYNAFRSGDAVNTTDPTRPLIIPRIDVTFYGHSGTYAESYANSYYIPFREVCPVSDGLHNTTAVEASEATCTDGAYTAGERCADCGEWISGHEQTAEPLGHDPAEAVRENVVEPTCTAAGGYDSVIRCARCGEILSSTYETLTMTAHADGDRDGCCDACGEDISNGNFTTGRVNSLITWRFNNETGELFLSGSGEMPSYRDCEQPFNKQAVKAVTVKDGITSVGESMFSTCYQLTSVSLPDSVTGIGNNAFADCNQLTVITLPASLTTIGQSAFASCTALPEITIPDGVTEIGVDAFRNCDGLTEIFIPDSVVSLGNEKPFMECDGLAFIQVGENNPVYHASGNCLIDTTKKTVIKGTYQSVIPDDGSVVMIGWCAFAGCSRLTEITIPDCVTSIGQVAFRDCAGLTELTLPSQLYFIGLGAFSGCAGLREVTIPAGAGEIDWYPFERCPGIARFTVEEGNTRYHSAGNCLIETKTGILLQGFGNSIIPDDGSVTSINNYAFSGNCPGMETIAIPAGITKIGAGAFEYCSDLTEIVLPDTVTAIGFGAFSSSGNLKIVIPDSVTDINNYAFSRSCTIYGHTGSAAETFAIGHKMRFMTVCPATEAFHHTASHDATDATCTEGGYTAGEQCAACGEWLSGHEQTAEPLGHRPEISRPERPATCLATGSTAEYTCAVCGVVTAAAEETPLAAHTDENGDDLCDVCRAPLTCDRYGVCGGCYWYADGATLVITGDGATGPLSGAAPWQAYRNEFDCVYIKEGVTAVDGTAFNGCTNVKKVFVPDGTEASGCEKPLLTYTFTDGVVGISGATGDGAFDGYDLLNAAYVFCADHEVKGMRFDRLQLNGADGSSFTEYDVLKSGKIVDENHFRLASGAVVNDFFVKPVSYVSFNQAMTQLGDHPDRNLILRVECDDLLTEEMKTDGGAYTVQLVLRFTDDPVVAEDDGPHGFMDSLIARFRATLAAILALFKKLIKLFTGR